MKAWVAGLWAVGALLGVEHARAQYPGSAPTSASSPEAQDEDENVERLDGERLRERFPTLQTRALPRVIQGSLGLGIKMLYLPVGAEGTLDLYPAP